jgi:hypothetical protein
MKFLFQEITSILQDWPTLPLLATAVATTIVLPFEQGLLFSAVCLMLVVMGLQVLLSRYDTLYDELLPIEWVHESTVSGPGAYAKASPWLAVLPLLHAAFWLVGWLALLAAAAWLTIPLWRYVRRASHKDRLVETGLQQLAAYRPSLAVHLSGSDGVAYQLNQWLPVLEALDVPTLILVRQRKCIPGIAPTPIPFMYAREPEHVERVLQAGIKTVLYPANPMKNLQLLRHYALNHFFINHGESDKEVNQSKLLMAYDKLLVGGPLAETRLRRAGLPIRDGQVVHVGRPQAEMLLTEAKTNAEVRTVLYAPTWEGFKEGANYSSLGPLALNIMDQLTALPGIHVIFKPHPYTGLRSQSYTACLQRIRKHCQRNGHEYVEPSVSIYESMNRSDMMITDISSVLADYLVTGKPIVLCLSDRAKEMATHEEHPCAAAAYHLSSDRADLAAVIEAINRGDPLAGRRRQVRGQVLGRFEESALQRFKNVVEESVTEPEISQREAISQSAV